MAVCSAAAGERGARAQQHNRFMPGLQARKTPLRAQAAPPWRCAARWRVDVEPAPSNTTTSCQVVRPKNPPARAGCAAVAVRSAVAVDVEPAPSNGRCLFAGVDIGAPPDVVWAALTDYDGLDSFIPGAPPGSCVTSLCAALREAEACTPGRLAQRPAHAQSSVP